MLNFAGIDGITVYHDGVQVASSTVASSIDGYVGPDTPSQGRIILGNSLNSTSFYSNMCIDELIFHNHVLTKEEITHLIQQ